MNLLRGKKEMKRGLNQLKKRNLLNQERLVIAAGVMRTASVIIIVT
jgi:hypothetical protein